MRVNLAATCAALSLALATQLPAASQQPQPLTERSFKGYRRYLAPAADQLQWMKVRWYPSYWEGVLQAHRQKKPILLWAMNGHPLGCT